MWQAEQVRNALQECEFEAELHLIRSDGDIDLQTPLYEMGVQGIFTRSLDIALLSGRIDMAVHSLKDVPTALPKGVAQAAVLKRGPVNDLLVYKGGKAFLEEKLGCADGYWGKIPASPGIFTFATSSIRRKAQWLHRYPGHQIENLRGNVNTRMRKLDESDWNGAIFAQAGLERIGLRPEHSVELNWMLPAPAQGAVVAVCREKDVDILQACSRFNDADTALCTSVERAFLRALLGGCSTPVSALAVVENDRIFFKGSLFSLNGAEKAEIELQVVRADAPGLGERAAYQLLDQGGRAIADKIQRANA